MRAVDSRRGSVPFRSQVRVSVSCETTISYGTIRHSIKFRLNFSSEGSCKFERDVGSSLPYSKDSQIRNSCSSPVTCQTSMLIGNALKVSFEVRDRWSPAGGMPQSS